MPTSDFFSDPSLRTLSSWGDLVDEFEKLYDEAKKEENKFTPKYIERNGDVTHVAWMDGTHTVVKRCEADGIDSNYSAFCAALAKKIFGTNARLHAVVDEHQLDAINKKNKELRDREIAIRNEEERINRNRKIKKMAKHMRLVSEAEARYQGRYQNSEAKLVKPE